MYLKTAYHLSRIYIRVYVTSARILSRVLNWSEHTSKIQEIQTYIYRLKDVVSSFSCLKYTLLLIGCINFAHKLLS